MTLSEFDVFGQEIRDQETEEIIKKGDPRRLLVRYRPDGSELFISARLNLPLLKAEIGGTSSSAVLPCKPITGAQSAKRIGRNE